MTTLEEVFIKANGEEEKDDSKKDGTPNVVEKLLDGDNMGDMKEHRGSSVNRDDQPLVGSIHSNKNKDKFDEESMNEEESKGLSSENLVGNGSLGQSIQALITKRFNIYKRDKCGLVCEVLVPVILVVIGLSFL